MSSVNACPSRSGVGRRSPSGPWQARCLGAARAKRCFLSIAPVRESRVNRPWTLPCPSSYMVSRVAAAASRSSRSRRAASWASAASGQATSRMCRPRCLSALASWSAARSSRCRSALLDHVGVEVVGQLGQGAEDGLGLLDVDPAGGQGGAGEVVVLEALGEPHRPVRGDPGGAGGVGVPVRGRGGAGVGGDLAPVGVGQDACLELGDLGGEGVELVEGRGGLGGVHRPDRDLGDGVELIAGTSQRPGDRVWLVGDRCHGPIPAPTTDTRSGPESLVDKGFRHLGCGRKVDGQGTRFRP